MNRSRVTGDLTASGLLYADITNDRVGIGSTQPRTGLDVRGTITTDLLIPGTDVSLSGTGLDTGDNVGLKFGDGDDFLVYHAGGGSGPNVIDNTTTNLEIRNGSDVQAKFIHDGAAELYHDGGRKLRTTSTGGILSGNWQLTDDNKILLGSSNDFELFHDHSNQWNVMGLVSGSALPLSLIHI